MAKVISFANQKGGVGKTTSAVNMAASLGTYGKRVLMIDLDPQGNATSGLGVEKRQLKASSKDILTGDVDIKDAIIETGYDNLSLIPTDTTLAGIEYELYDMLDYEELPYRLKNVVAPILSDYDYIIIDCPPSLGMITINAFTASDGVVVPVQSEFYALEGLSQLIKTIKGIKQKYNPELLISGILITMHSSISLHSRGVVNELKKYYADKLFDTRISRNIRLAEAASYGMPVYYYDKSAKGSKEYLEVAKELLDRI